MGLWPVFIFRGVVLALAFTVIALTLECGGHAAALPFCAPESLVRTALQKQFSPIRNSLFPARMTQLETCTVEEQSGGTAAALQTLKRTFFVGAPQRYRVRLTVLSELEGKRPLQIGSQTYVEPVSRSVEASLSWRATRAITSVNDAGSSATIEEALDEFDFQEAKPAAGDDESQKVAAVLNSAFRAWMKQKTISYHELPSGQISGLASDAAPALDENSPLVLTLWLLRALRPAAALPDKLISFGQQWQEPRKIELVGWKDAQGSESQEWLEATGAAEPAVRLHVTQQISAQLPPGAAPGSERDTSDAGKGTAKFLGESLSTIALSDARVLSATRSASREILWTFENVPGLTEPQRFRARLAAQIEISDCQNDPCLAANRAAP